MKAMKRMQFASISHDPACAATKPPRIAKNEASKTEVAHEDPGPEQAESDANNEMKQVRSGAQGTGQHSAKDISSSRLASFPPTTQQFGKAQPIEMAGSVDGAPCQTSASLDLKQAQTTRQTTDITQPKKQDSPTKIKPRAMPDLMSFDRKRDQLRAKGQRVVATDQDASATSTIHGSSVASIMDWEDSGQVPQVALTPRVAAPRAITYRGVRYLRADLASDQASGGDTKQRSFVTLKASPQKVAIVDSNQSNRPRADTQEPPTSQERGPPSSPTDPKSAQAMQREDLLKLAQHAEGTRVAEDHQNSRTSPTKERSGYFEAESTPLPQPPADVVREDSREGSKNSMTGLVGSQNASKADNRVTGRKTKSTAVHTGAGLSASKWCTQSAEGNSVASQPDFLRTLMTIDKAVDGWPVSTAGSLHGLEQEHSRQAEKRVSQRSISVAGSNGGSMSSVEAERTFCGQSHLEKKNANATGFNAAALPNASSKPGEGAICQDEGGMAQKDTLEGSISVASPTPGSIPGMESEQVYSSRPIPETTNTSDNTFNAAALPYAWQASDGEKVFQEADPGPTAAGGVHPASFNSAPQSSPKLTAAGIIGAQVSSPIVATTTSSSITAHVKKSSRPGLMASKYAETDETNNGATNRIASAKSHGVVSNASIFSTQKAEDVRRPNLAASKYAVMEENNDTASGKLPWPNDRSTKDVHQQRRRPPPPPKAGVLQAISPASTNLPVVVRQKTRRRLDSMWLHARRLSSMSSDSEEEV